MGGRGQAPASFLLGASIYEVRGTSRAEARVVACSAVAHCADGTTTGSLYGRFGYEFTENWGLYGLLSMGLGVNVITFHDFLEFPAIPRFSAGIGAHWRHGRFTLGLEADALFTITGGSKMLGGEIRILPKYNIIIPEDLFIAYALSFPITAEFSADGMAVSVGIAVSMEVGKHLE